MPRTVGLAGASLISALSIVAVLLSIVALLLVSPPASAKKSGCANPKRGSGKGDRLMGTRAGDRITAGKGRDLVRGRANADCLKGGGGADKLHGDDGSDRLRGGAGSDALQGGPGPDALIGGGGSDFLRTADGQTDVVYCGGGRDRARVDERDELRGCERVAGGSPPAPSGEAPVASAPPPPACQAPSGDVLATGLPGCQPLFQDLGSSADPVPIWGSIDCAAPTRHQHVGSGGDSHYTGTRAAQGNDDYRVMTAYDGDDYYGERCELGKNWRDDGRTVLYREGQRRVTFFSLRLGSNIPLDTDEWQVVMQMKQTNPAANGDGAPIISLEAKDGRWRLMNDWDELWSAPAQRSHWTRFAFDVRYSQNPSVGSIRAYVDLNGDGDAADSNEQSPLMYTQTLKPETSGGAADDGIAPGQSIPSHLRLGLYHDPEISCGGGCSVGVDNVQVFSAP
jgi:Polysaccharide lyase/RTX calcium-binding nonapeptide repeat (4 copies)